MLDKAVGEVSGLCRVAREEQWGALMQGRSLDWGLRKGFCVEYEELQGEVQIGGVFGE